MLCRLGCILAEKVENEIKKKNAKFSLKTNMLYLQQMLFVAMNIKDYETSDAEKKAEKVLFDALQRDKVYQK